MIFLDFRAWENTTLGRILERANGGRNPGVFFKIMSYNVLSQDLLVDHPELYRKNEPRALQWDIRWKNLFQEIKEHDCDVILFITNECYVIEGCSNFFY